MSALARVPQKFVRLYSFDFDGVDWNTATADGKIVHTLGLSVRRTFCEVYYLFLIACCLIALARGLPRTRVLTCDNVLIFLGLGIIGYFTTLYMVYYGMPRYHIPMMPWIIMYAALTLNTLTSSPSPPRAKLGGDKRRLP